MSEERNRKRPVSPRRTEGDAPEAYSREWKDDYRRWYENWRREHWNEKFRNLNRSRSA